MEDCSSIFKEGEKCERSNYLRISLLPVIARLSEKLVFDQLYQYQGENGFMSKDKASEPFIQLLHLCLNVRMTGTSV